MASISEVARRAGVSITTVSRVLNPVSGYPVAEATRRRVLNAAQAMQYSPSALARALVTRRSRMVGVLLGDIVDPYFAEIVRGIEDVARRAGYLVVICNTSRDPGTERRYVTALREYRADAIIFLGGDIFDAPTRRALERDLETLARHGAVAVAVAGDHANLPAIDIDHAAGSQAAAGRLLAQQPTAIFAANDQMALGVLAACRAAGIDVPSEMTVVGFGNTSAAEHAVPGLTTLSMPRHQLGVEAMQAVLDALELDTPRVFPRRLPFHLVIRESS